MRSYLVECTQASIEKWSDEKKKLNFDGYDEINDEFLTLLVYFFGIPLTSHDIV